MSNPATKQKARAQALELARRLVDDLHAVEDPVAHLTEQLYPVLRQRNVAQSNVGNLTARGKNLERRITFLLQAGATVHEQLLNVVAQRDLWVRECTSLRRASNEQNARSMAFSAWLLRLFSRAREQASA